jgi:predicted nucleic acid-binding protein
MSQLVDTSAWIEYFKGDSAFLFIKGLLKINSVCVNDVVLTELLPSMRRRRETELIDLITSIPKIDVIIDWDEIQAYQLENLRHGNNNVPLTDMIIAQNCIQNKVELIARDNHFNIMSGYLPLKMYSDRAQKNRNEK